MYINRYFTHQSHHHCTQGKETETAENVNKFIRQRDDDLKIEKKFRKIHMNTYVAVKKMGMRKEK